MRREAVVWTFGRICVVALLLVLGSASLRAQFEIAPDHFDGPNTEPIPQAKPANFPIQSVAQKGAVNRGDSCESAFQIPFRSRGGMSSTPAEFQMTAGSREARCGPTPARLFETLTAYQHTAERGVRILCDILAIVGFVTKADGRYALTTPFTAVVAAKP